jgi:DNA-binding MarR family transcriptional regulator
MRQADDMSGEGGRGDDLGVLAGRLLFAVQGELFGRLRERGFDDIVPRHGAVLAYLRPEGVRATELSRLSGQVKQVIGVIVDDLEVLGYVERKPDPSDRRAKLVVPTARGRRQMAAADAIMADIMNRHARGLGAGRFHAFLTDFRKVIDHQLAAANEASRSSAD